MRPMSAAASTNSERLPGIAHLDEQMHTPWSVDNARRTAGLRGDTGDDSLRRLSAQSFPHSGRTWRFSLPDDSSTSPLGRTDLQPPTLPPSIRRASSPSRSNFEQHSTPQPIYRSHYADRSSLSPGSRRSPPEDSHIASYSSRTSDERAYPPRLPSREDRRYQGAIAPYDSRDEQYSSYSQDRRNESASDMSHYRYSTTQPHHRDTDMNQSHSSYSHHGSNDQSYGHRMMDRDSPSYYEETGPRQQRMEGGSHSYPMSGMDISPSIPRRRGKLPKVVTDLLKSWLLDHSSHPYPTEDEKRRLCSVTGLSISQVSNWFINARRRILVPQGSGNFALGQPSGSGGTPPSHHLAPPQSHHAPSHHLQQHYHHATSFQDEGKHQMYRTASATSRSHSPDSLPHLSRRSFDEQR